MKKGNLKRKEFFQFSEFNFPFCKRKSTLGCFIVDHSCCFFFDTSNTRKKEGHCKFCEWMSSFSTGYQKRLFAEWGWNNKAKETKEYKNIKGTSHKLSNIFRRKKELFEWKVFLANNDIALRLLFSFCEHLKFDSLKVKLSLQKSLNEFSQFF